MSSNTISPEADAHLHALPIGQRLGDHEIRGVLGAGGFGIVYRAFDAALEREVAIKEYLPSALAARSATLQVSVLSQGHAETFALGLKSFVNEARLLARFDHPSLVKVHRFWEAHGTAYMVMPLYRGRTLKALRADWPAPDEAALRALIEPLLGALEVLHAEGVYHRDIAPDNILVGESDGRPVLLDFGAARRVIGAGTQTLTAILKPSYAPIEQYAESTGLRQGPWTDLYALGATLRFAITGAAPQPATARAVGGGQSPLAETPREGLSREFLQTIDWMMALRPEQRPQSVAALRAVLSGQAAVPALPAPAVSVPATAWERTVVQPGERDDASAAPLVLTPTTAPAARTPPPPVAASVPPAAAPRRHTATWAAAAAVMVVLGGAAAAWWPASAPEPARTATAPVAAPVTLAAAPTEKEDAPAPAVVADAVPASNAAVEPAAPAPKMAAAPAPRPKRAPAPAAAAPTPPDTTPPAEPVVVADAPTAPAATAAASPREQCAGRLLVALHRCLKRVCETPAMSTHRDCRRVRLVEANTLSSHER